MLVQFPLDTAALIVGVLELPELQPARIKAKAAKQSEINNFFSNSDS